MSEGNTWGPPGPILFNIFLSDLFLVVQNVDFASYAGSSTIYDAGDNIDEIFKTNELTEFQIGDLSIKNSGCEKFLGVNIDSKLNFDSHINHLCNKVNKKLRSLVRVTSYITLEKKKIVMNSFFNAQFNRCPLIWMLHSRKNNNKIKHLYERCLQLIYSDRKLS